MGGSVVQQSLHQKACRSIGIIAAACAVQTPRRKILKNKFSEFPTARTFRRFVGHVNATVNYILSYRVFVCVFLARGVYIKYSKLK